MHAVYHDIVENERIVYSYEMLLDGVRMSVSLSTLELRARRRRHPADPDRAGCLLHRQVESDAAQVAGRKEGTDGLLDALKEYVEGS